MAEVAQEESSTPVKAVAVEVETEAPAVPAAPTGVVAEVEAVATTPLKEVVTAVEKEVAAVATKAKRVVKNAATGAVAEVKAVEDKTRIAITAEEHNIALKMENEFLKLSQQINVFQQQAANIQKQFPEYIKGLASKYVVDLTKHTFNAIEGVFTKN